MKKRVLAIGVASVLAIAACRSDKYIPGICFQDNILPIFVSKCSTKGCHGGKDQEGGYNLTTYDGIMKGITPKYPIFSEIYNKIKGSDPEMPPKKSPQLTSQEVELIKSWIQFGAENSSNCNTSCDTSNITYSGGVAPILITYCTGCHTGSSAGGGIVLTDYASVKTVVENGKLMGSINQTAGYSAMPKNSVKLNDCKMKVIQKWINSGYPNN